MATMTSGFCTTLLPRPAAIEPSVWSTWNGTFTTEAGATHNGERIWDPSPGNSFRSFAASNTVLVAMEARNYYGTGTGLAQQQAIFNIRNAGGSSITSLRCDNAGNLYLYNALTLIASTTSNPIASNSTYYTLELAWRAPTSNYSIETRINGLRIPEMTTTDFGAAGGQPAGTLGQAAATFPGSVITNNEVAPTTNVTNPRIYWYAQKNGTSAWTTVTTSTSFATQTDFLGLKKRAWISPTSVGNYPIANWINGVGTYPASIADTLSGMDSDSSYIKNVTSGTSVSADKISHHYTQLPGTASTIGFVQRTILARSDQVANSDTIRSGLRSPGTATPANTDFMDSNDVLSSTYGAGVSFAGSTYLAQMPYTIGGTSVWSASTMTTALLEGVDEQLAIT